MGVWFRARMEEPCKLDGFLSNVLEVARDVLRLPVTVNRLYIGLSGGLTLCMLVTYPMHDRAACSPLGEKLAQIVDTLRLLEEEHRLSTSNEHIGGGRPLLYD